MYLDVDPYTVSYIGKEINTHTHIHKHPHPKQTQTPTSTHSHTSTHAHTHTYRVSHIICYIGIDRFIHV
jgi:hypothetical protein